MSWEVEYTNEFRGWFDELEDGDQSRIIAAVEIVEHHGPAAGRPVVDSVKGSRQRGMKEIRIGTIRILFAFDPRRVAILLIGGDKRGEWERWYERMVSVADELYDVHLTELRQEGLI